MTSFTPAEIREFAKHGATIEKHEVVKARERPHWYDEVGAPHSPA